MSIIAVFIWIIYLCLIVLNLLSPFVLWESEVSYEAYIASAVIACIGALIGAGLGAFSGDIVRGATLGWLISNPFAVLLCVDICSPEPP